MELGQGFPSSWWVHTTPWLTPLGGPAAPHGLAWPRLDQDRGLDCQQGETHEGHKGTGHTHPQLPQ